MWTAKPINVSTTITTCDQSYKVTYNAGIYNSTRTYVKSA